jgi:conjugal transfer/entry exclusion protein
MHRQLLQVNSKIQVHHCNHNTLDNRRSNLEPMTPQFHIWRHAMDRIQKMPIDHDNKHR